jgi:hypothetical protein
LPISVQIITSPASLVAVAKPFAFFMAFSLRAVRRLAAARGRVAGISWILKIAGDIDHEVYGAAPRPAETGRIFP